MDLKKIKYSPKGTKNYPYWEYWTDSAVKRGNRRKGYMVRVYGKILNCPVCNKKFFATASQLRNCKDAKKISCSCKCAGTLRRGKNNPYWSGGTSIDKNGYKHISVEGYKGTDIRGYVLEHRYVMEQHIGRRLKKWEVVHHKNRKRLDNRIENLELVSHSHSYDVENGLKREIRRLECLLEKHGIVYS